MLQDHETSAILFLLKMFNEWCMRLTCHTPWTFTTFFLTRSTLLFSSAFLLRIRGFRRKRKGSGLKVLFYCFIQKGLTKRAWSRICSRYGPSYPNMIISAWNEMGWLPPQASGVIGYIGWCEIRPFILI